MGWAKYTEDNIEIMLERLSNTKRNEQKITVKVICNPAERETELNSPDDIRRTSDFEKKNYEDKYIICKDCGKKFLCSARTQKYFDLKGWNDPKRCKECKSFRNTRYLMCSSF